MEVPSSYLWTSILLGCILCLKGVDTHNDSFLFRKIVENRATASDISSWQAVRSKLACSAQCVTLAGCIAFQYGLMKQSFNITKAVCSLMFGDTKHVVYDQQGIDIYQMKHCCGNSASAVNEPTTVSAVTTSSVASETTVIITEDPLTTTALTTPLPPPSGGVEAAFAMSNYFVLFSGTKVYFYNNTNSLMIGPYQTLPVSSYIPGWSGKIVAAYTDVLYTTAYFLTDSEVKTYQLPSMAHLFTQTYAQHFSGFLTLPIAIDDITYDNQGVYIIYNDSIYKTNRIVMISARTSHNPYKSKDPAPTGVSAAMIAQTGKSIFFSSSAIYEFTPPTKGPSGNWDLIGHVRY